MFVFYWFCLSIQVRYYDLHTEALVFNCVSLQIRADFCFEGGKEGKEGENKIRKGRKEMNEEKNKERIK